VVPTNIATADSVLQRVRIAYPLKHSAQLVTTKEGGRCENPSFKPNDTGNNLAYLCMLHYGLESDQLSLRVYNPTSGVKNETNRTPFMISSYIWAPEEGLN
jgi:hypothetical protein